jgi:2-polyprenyl-3-methyl-5-hydroxy-6-metoxy-1,4-benzoquinol methylase
MLPAEFQLVRRAEGWVSVSPLPTRDQLQDFYANLYFQEPQSTTYQTSYDGIASAYRRLKCATLLHALEHHGLRAGAAFLDVGAGEGFLMEVADERGLEVTGVDFSSFGIERFVPRLAPRLLAGDVIETIDRLGAAGRRFEACSAINVLEHVIHPDQLLASIRTILAPNGLLAVTVPNDFSTLQQLLRREGLVNRDFWWAPPQHLHYFNAENLPRFCAANGYEVVDAFSDFPIDLFLLHPGSNYIADPSNGRAAHLARMRYDLLIAEAGLDAYLELYRALFKVAIGRDITVVLRPAASA